MQQSHITDEPMASWKRDKDDDRDMPFIKCKATNFLSSIEMIAKPEGTQSKTRTQHKGSSNNKLTNNSWTTANEQQLKPLGDLYYFFWSYLHPTRRFCSCKTYAMYHHRETTKINYQTVMIQRKVISTHTQTDRAKKKNLFESQRA